MESSLTEFESLLRQPATDNTSLIHTPHTQNPTPPINIWNVSTRTSKMCENLEIAVKSTNNQAPLVDIEKLVVDNGIRINRKYVNKNSGETVFVLPSKSGAGSFKSKFSETFPNT